MLRREVRGNSMRSKNTKRLGPTTTVAERAGARMLDVWLEPIAVGQVLPTMPLWLRGGLCLPVALETTYERTCIEQRVRPAA